MKCKYADRGKVERLLDGRMSQEEADAMRVHLATDCPQCEAFFGEMDELAFHERAQVLWDRRGGFMPISSEERARVFSELQARRLANPQIGDQREPRGHRPQPWVWGVSALVAATVVVFVLLPSGPDSSWRFKGTGTVTLELQQASVLDGHLHVSGDILNGGKVIRGNRVLIHYHAPSEGTLSLHHRGADGTQRLLYQSATVEGVGDHLLEQNGEALTFDTTDLEGEQTLEAVFSPSHDSEVTRAEVRFRVEQ